jgi:hypothetical protein
MFCIFTLTNFVCARCLVKVDPLTPKLEPKLEPKKEVEDDDMRGRASQPAADGWAVSSDDGLDDEDEDDGSDDDYAGAATLAAPGAMPGGAVVCVCVLCQSMSSKVTELCTRIVYCIIGVACVCQCPHSLVQ